MNDFPHTTKQINRAGDRIRKATDRGNAPRDSDLVLLDEFRALHYPTLRHVQDRLSRLLHKRLGLRPVELFPVTARPLKTRQAITIAANDYEKLADLLERANRLDRPFYRAVRRLSEQAPAEDEASLAKYLALSHELDNYGDRYIKALRQHDDDELARLVDLREQTRNRRTRLTARMGLKECGS